MGMAIQMYLDIPFIGEKLLAYQTGDEKGQGIVSVNAFNVVQLFAIIAFYYMLYFYDTIASKNNYFPLLMKIFAIGTATFVAFAFFPVIGDRLGYQMKMVNIILYSTLAYTIHPRWAGLIAIFFIGCIHLVYILSYAFIP